MSIILDDLAQEAESLIIEGCYVMRGGPIEMGTVLVVRMDKTGTIITNAGCYYCERVTSRRVVTAKSTRGSLVVVAVEVICEGCYKVIDRHPPGTPRERLLLATIADWGARSDIKPDELAAKLRDRRRAVDLATERRELWFDRLRNQAQRIWGDDGRQAASSELSSGGQLPSRPSLARRTTAAVDDMLGAIDSAIGAATR